MTAEDSPPAERFSLSRWSRRKREAARATQAEAPAAAAPAAPPVEVAPPADVAPAATPAMPAAAPLPPVENLTFDSDFAPFVQPKIDESTKRAALKKLFADPHFNAMDGLDVYVDDYTQPDPMPTGMLDKLARVYDALVDEDPTAAGVARSGEPDTGAGAAAAVPPAAARDPASVADVSESAPLAPTLAPHAGKGSAEGRGS